MNTEKQTYHFYASSAGNWMVDNDMHSLIARMDKEGLGYNLVYVPVPIDSNYEIRLYTPIVEDCIWLGYKGSSQ